MKTRARPAAGAAASAARQDVLPLAGRADGVARPGWSSRVCLTREAATAAVWAMFPAVLGGAVESLAAGRPCFAVLVVILHQFVALFLGGRNDGRHTVWGELEWAILVVGAAATVAVADYVLWPWLLLPIGPALLLRAAKRENLLPRMAGLMRVFSVATLGAILVQLASAVPSAGIAIAALGGTVLYLAGVERLATGERLR
ncbi:MAG: hypothetical protein WBC44_00105 [Planctomycetaceae bacterium]